MERIILKGLGCEILRYYSIYDYVKLYFIDFKVCNKDSYSKEFIDHTHENLNLFEKLEAKTSEIAIHSHFCFKSYSLPIYSKGLGVLVYSYELIKQNCSDCCKSQLEFIQEWVRKFFYF